MDDKQVTVKEAQDLLGVSKGTIYNLIRRGELHVRKMKVGSGLGGQRVWLDRAEVLALKGAEIVPAGGKPARKK